MKKDSDKAWAARKLRGVVVRAVQCAEQEAKLLVPMAEQEAAEKLRAVAEVRRRLGIG